jgi:RNA polymerase sigma-70 factor, ECF subfamily
VSARRAEAIYDELLLLRCRRGEGAAWRELLARWERPLFFYVRRFVPREEDAWDVLQQTWLAVFNGLGRLRDATQFPVWLHRIARNLAISYRRGMKPIEPLPQAVEETDASDPAANAIEFEDAQRVHRALDRVSLAHREVLTLFFLQDLSLEQIADVIDSPVGTIKSRLHYARQALRCAMDKEAES